MDTQTMISIQTSSSPKQYTANILPCRIKYTGSVNASPHLWNPQTAQVSTDSSNTNTNDNQDHETTPETAGNNTASTTVTDTEQKSTTTTHTSHFRGRRLIGTSIQLPDGYKGHILTPSKPSTTTTTSSSAALLQKQKQAGARYMYGDEDDDEDQAVEDEDEEEEEAIDVTNWESSAQFNDIMLWNHEAPVEIANDGIARGIQEWIGFSHVIHGLDVDEGN